MKLFVYLFMKNGTDTFINGIIIKNQKFSTSLMVKMKLKAVIFLQICFCESRDPLGQKSLHPKLKVMHPFWDLLITNIVHSKLRHMHPIQRSQIQPNRSPGSFSDSWLSVDLFVLFVLRLNVPVNNFSVMSGRSHRFLGN